MDLETTIFMIIVASTVGAGLGYFLRLLITLGKKGSIEVAVKKIILEAKEEAQRITKEASISDTRIKEQLKKHEESIESERKRNEERYIRKDEILDKRQVEIDEERNSLKQKAGDIRSLRNKIDTKLQELATELKRVSGLSQEEAKNELLNEVEKNSQEDILIRMRKLDFEGAERLDKKAKAILTTAIQRLANSTANEIMTTSVPIASDDIKGKVIGKEGRNIRAFERASGVELVVDDAPGTILISSFDPIRRQIARVALENLIADGRIQPAKIESVVEKAKEEINKIIKEKGDKAAYECGVYNLDPRIISILGRLHFRTSYGQNVLQHSVEMAHISGVLASELGADIAIAKAGALLHDIGKAVTHEVEGTHVEIGRRILQKFGADEKIILAMQSHHEEYPYETPESIIVQTADAISGGRPGARRDSVENYLKRLQELEAIANSFAGVEKTYALQAGREIRIFVQPKKINDIQAKKLAREVALRVESELKYPGEIKVNVIRESRSVEFAR